MIPNPHTLDDLDKARLDEIVVLLAAGDQDALNFMNHYMMRNAHITARPFMRLIREKADDLLQAAFETMLKCNWRVYTGKRILQAEDMDNLVPYIIRSVRWGCIRWLREDHLIQVPVDRFHKEAAISAKEGRKFDIKNVLPFLPENAVDFIHEANIEDTGILGFSLPDLTDIDARRFRLYLSTRRQKTILTKILEGWTIREIGAFLTLSHTAIQIEVKSIRAQYDAFMLEGAVR